MSFRRPKKAIRPKVVILNEDSDSAEEKMEVEVDTEPSSNSSNGKGKLSFDEEVVSFKKRERKPEKEEKKSTLSFDDFEDGEVFQVKKSSVSRRLMKQRGKEKKVMPEKSEDDKRGSSRDRKFTSQIQGFTNQIRIKQDDSGVKKEAQDFIRVLNGREAEALHMESEDEEEDDDVGGVEHKFRRPAAGGAIHDAVRRALEQGQIPDANLIHEARKRKQMARDMGNGDFIPVDNVDRLKKEKSRLVREDDDNDESDEERIDFSSATNAAKMDRDKRIEDFNAAQDEFSGGEHSDNELDEWESQQIRKGVSQAKMHDVAKEMFGKEYVESASFRQINTKMEDAGGFSVYPSQVPPRKGKTQAFVEQTIKVASIEEIVSGSKKITPEQVLKQMSDRLERLKLSRDRNAGEISRMQADLDLAEKELGEAEELKPEQNSRFILYQNLRGYVVDLVDCLRCKISAIESLEKRMIDLLKSRRERFAERRRQDVRDQTDEVAATINIMGGNLVSKPPPINAERTRRAAEREGRRTRRRKLREKNLSDAKLHKDGGSSDDEEPDIEYKAYLASKENILGEVSSIFEDVHEDFATVNGILSRFEEWRDSDFDSYKESYAYMCVPKCVAPLIRVQLISWDPLSDASDFTKQNWMKALFSYAYHDGETYELLKTDPDSRLVPSVLEKVFLPWISRVVEARWDPISTSQTTGLVNVLKRLVEDYSINPNCKPMHSLLENVVVRLKDALENDIYVPIYPKSAMANSFTPGSVFISRQFWSSVKLLSNMSKWQGLLSDRPLQALALDALLTRYTLLGIRVTSDLTESIDRAKGVLQVLPKVWLRHDRESDIPNGLQQFSRCLVSLAQSSDLAIATNRMAIPELANVLKAIGFSDEAQIILRKYS